ncbi:hypothetical protein N2152v2_004956 [Parachlorella kessleri]
MSAVSIGGSRNQAPKPPEKGVFPLDHFGECTTVKDEYLKCLADSKGDADACREVTKRYLRNLMAPQSLEELGFKEGEAQAQPRPKGPEQPKQSREQTGFIAGLYVKQPYQQK